jgi:hypothetical protein
VLHDAFVGALHTKDQMQPDGMDLSGAKLFIQIGDDGPGREHGGYNMSVERASYLGQQIANDTARLVFAGALHH